MTKPWCPVMFKFGNQQVSSSEGVFVEGMYVESQNKESIVEGGISKFFQLQAAMKMCVILGWKLVGQEFMSKPSKADLGLGELWVPVITVISENTLDQKA